ncbi:MAG: sigma 54-interacting transcriptional regulator [Bacteroidales bacterium]|nr:sigma 54-interacting transcriptional regulator [Bacteroidales bacterium]
MGGAIEFCQKTGRGCYGKTDLPLLLEISKMINYSSDIKEVLYPVLKVISEYVRAEKASLSILNRQKSKIFIEVGYGYNDKNVPKVEYNIGEGIIGEVVKTGNPVYIPKIYEDKRYLNKLQVGLLTKDRQNLSFICVPVTVDIQIAGTLSILKVYDENLNQTEMIRLLSIIGSMIAQAVRARQDRLEEIEILKAENAHLHSELKGRFQPSNIIGNSGKMREVYKLVERVTKTNATVLIRGESGTGKELIADAIHYNSSRANKPFIKVNCSALPESLIESELFGHEKGSFTGAENLRKGRFELAQGGTIFLDEIGDLPAQTQVKLLRIIQQREFERVGGTETIHSDVRIITATNRNLEELVKEDKFREDLYYRINVFPIFLPSLRERINDIPILADHFIQKCNEQNSTVIKRISSSAIDMLMVYHWPGNIRELENCIERAGIMSTDGVIRSHNLPPTLQTAKSSGTENKGTLDAILERVEKQLIMEALTSSLGNCTQAAKMLGITERIMGLRTKKYNINLKKYKEQKGIIDE